MRSVAIAGGGERSHAQGSDRWWRGAVSSKVLRSLVEGSGLRWMEDIAGSWKQALALEELSQVEWSNRCWRGAV